MKRVVSLNFEAKQTIMRQHVGAMGIWKEKNGEMSEARVWREKKGKTKSKLQNLQKNWRTHWTFYIM